MTNTLNCRDFINQLSAVADTQIYIEENTQSDVWSTFFSSTKPQHYRTEQICTTVMSSMHYKNA